LGQKIRDAVVEALGRKKRGECNAKIPGFRNYGGAWWKKKENKAVPQGIGIFKLERSGPLLSSEGRSHLEKNMCRNE